MIKNTKILKNNDKILMGERLKSLIYSNNYYSSSLNFKYSAVGATPSNPLYIYIYDTNGYKLETVTNNVTNVTLNYTNVSSGYNDRYIITYGNVDALTHFETDYVNGVGDIDKFIDLHVNLIDFLTTTSAYDVDFNYFKWNNSMRSISISLDDSISGSIETMGNLETLEKLEIIRVDKFGGDISGLVSLNYLSLNLQGVTKSVTGAVNNWSFIPNLTYLNLTNCNLLTGNMDNFSFNDNLTYIHISNNELMTGNITNWDFSSCGDLTTLRLESVSSPSNITGDLSGWVFPISVVLDEIRFNTLGITNIGMDISNITSLTTFRLSTCNSITSNIDDLVLPDNTTNLYINNCSSLVGDFSVFSPPTSSLLVEIINTNIGGDLVVFINGLTSTTETLTIKQNNTTGSVSGLTLPTNITLLDLSLSNLTGNLSSSTSIPVSLEYFTLGYNNIVLDLSSYCDWSNIYSINLTSISGITGDFSNLDISKCGNFSIGNNSFTNDIGDLNFNYDELNALAAFNMVSNSSDLTPWFPSGYVSAMLIIELENSDYIGSITNWVIGSWISGGYLRLDDTNLSGDISNWAIAMPSILKINNTNISGDIGALDFISNNTTDISAYNASMIGNLSGVTLIYGCGNFYCNDNVGITGSDNFVDYVWLNRKNWSNNININISNIGDSPSGTYQLGDLGTFPDHEWDLTEAQINNLVNGIDYNGLGTNIVWSKREKLYYLLTSNVSEFSSIRKYKVTTFIY